jgi:hypothetical protein
MWLGTTLHAQGRTDLVTLGNGDRITGEVVRLERGRLEFDTDDAGTLYLEWDKLATVVTARLVEVITIDGRHYLGSLGLADPRSIAVASPDGVVPLQMSEVTFITAIGRSFWTKFDGAIDAGFSYTRSSGVEQFTLNWDTVYRKPASQVRLTASITQTSTEEVDSSDDRGALEASYRIEPWQRWFVLAVGRFETNESLGLELRSQAGAAVGPTLINGAHGQMAAGAGMVVNHEQGVDVEPTDNVEGLLAFRASYYTYDRPKTNLDLSFQYYPSFSNFGRQRIQFDTSMRRELLKDFFVALNLFDTFDSDPPNPDADRNDIGVVISLGWSY